MHFPVFGESLKTEAILQWHPTLHAFTFWAEIWVGGKGREKWKLTQQRGKVEKAEHRIGPR